jgi:hypothetical protein
VRRLANTGSLLDNDDDDDDDEDGHSQDRGELHQQGAQLNQASASPRLSDSPEELQALCSAFGSLDTEDGTHHKARRKQENEASGIPPLHQFLDAEEAW